LSPLQGEPLALPFGCLDYENQNLLSHQFLVEILQYHLVLVLPQHLNLFAKLSSLGLLQTFPNLTQALMLTGRLSLTEMLRSFAAKKLRQLGLHSRLPLDFE
jgi:hypothetical protein